MMTLVMDIISGDGKRVALRSQWIMQISASWIAN